MGQYSRLTNNEILIQAISGNLNFASMLPQEKKKKKSFESNNLAFEKTELKHSSFPPVPALPY